MWPVKIQAARTVQPDAVGWTLICPVSEAPPIPTALPFGWVCLPPTGPMHPEHRTRFLFSSFPICAACGPSARERCTPAPQAAPGQGHQCLNDTCPVYRQAPCAHAWVLGQHHLTLKRTVWSPCSTGRGPRGSTALRCSWAVAFSGHNASRV